MQTTDEKTQHSSSSYSRTDFSQSGTDINEVAHDIAGTFKDYARERPDVVALWCFGIGFVLGWKLKPW